MSVNNIISSNDIYFSYLFPGYEVVEGRIPVATSDKKPIIPLDKPTSGGMCFIKKD